MKRIRITEEQLYPGVWALGTSEHGTFYALANGKGGWKLRRDFPGLSDFNLATVATINEAKRAIRTLIQNGEV